MSRLAVAVVVASLAAVAACGSGDGKLRVTDIDPKEGDADGGQYVRIYGNAFTCDGNCARAAKVYFGSRKGNLIRFASDREIVVEAPGGKPNETVDVLIYFEPGGELRIPKAFTFKEKAAPSYGPPPSGK